MLYNVQEGGGKIMSGEIINSFFETITWTNFGGPLITILGRDIGMFIIGYLTHLIISGIIETIKEKRNDN